MKPQQPPVLYDRLLVLAAISLAAIGLLMVSSASIGVAMQQHGQSFYYLVRQGIYLTIGLVMALIILRIPVKAWEKLGFPLLFLSFILLLAVFLPGIGHTVNGSTRWLGFGSVSLQVSEAVKFCVIIYLAGYIVRHHEALQTEFAAFIRPLIVLMMIALLLLLEPDFGATMVLTLTMCGMLFLAGVRIRQFVLIMSIVAIAAATLAISSPYRLQRLTTFLNPWAEAFGGGYQLTQALIAFGRGGWTGVGLGESVQKLFYLPEAHTDFLFAVLVEELGLIGAIAVLILFCIIFIRAVSIAKRAIKLDQMFAGFVAYGLAFWLGLQVLINIGVSSGVLPTKGLTLPLLSYGGSSLVMNCIVIALLLRIDHENRWLTYGFPRGMHKQKLTVYRVT